MSWHPGYLFLPKKYGMAKNINRNVTDHQLTSSKEDKYNRP